MLAKSTERFEQTVGFEDVKDGRNTIKTTTFAFWRGLLDENGQS